MHVLRGAPKKAKETLASNLNKEYSDWEALIKDGEEIIGPFAQTGVTIENKSAQELSIRIEDKAFQNMDQAMQLVSALKEALARELEQGLVITDEASAMEAAGFSPLLVHGSGRNVKVTWPEDFAWVESWL